MIVTCSKCQSVYELTEKKLIVRDIDSINCRVCQTEIFDWNGASMWTAKLIDRKEAKSNTEQ